MNTNRIFTGNLICDNEFKGTYLFFKAGKKYLFLNDINSILDLKLKKI